MEVYIGMIFLFAGNFAPLNFAFCDGRLLPITSYQALFAILGTNFGGNGTSNFALPDLRGRAAIGMGAGPGLSPYVLGQIGGNEQTALQIANLPSHNHTLNGDQNGSGKEFPGPNHVIGASTTDKMYSVNAPNVAMKPVSIGMTGSNVPFSNIQPYLALNYIIALNGIFPSRN